jgi:hypothetical protein
MKGGANSAQRHQRNYLHWKIFCNP